MALKGEIILEYDQESREYVAFWEPVIIGMGETERDAIDDLTAAANLFLDTCQEKLKTPKEE
jgi:predicted RNase H-like HicB family nuclease